MMISDDIELLFSRISSGNAGLSEAQLIALDPLPNDYFSKAGHKTLSIADALLQVRDELAKLLKDGEQLNRFSVSYIRVSKLIRNSLTVLGQGLMTLHQEGFDLRSYPLSIYELRCIASFHFKKTMNGARAAREKNQTIYFRCLTENLEWMKLLCRLEQSEHKLQQTVKAIAAPQKTVIEAAEPAAKAIADEKPFAEAKALPPMRALPAMSESKKKELTSADEKTEARTEPAEKTEKSKPVKAVHTSQDAPYTLGAYSLQQWNSPFGEKLPERHRSCDPAHSHPPWKE